MPDDIRTRRIVYSVAGMDRINVQRDLAFRGADGQEQRVDVYAPANTAGRRAAIIFVHGGPLPVGETRKDDGVFRSYGELAAASGIVGITFNHRYHAPADILRAEADIRAAIDYARANADRLQIDRDRLAIWTYSGGGPLVTFVLREVPSYIRCLVAYYAVLDLQQPPGPLPPGVTQDMLRRYSPLAYLRENRDKIPPLFVARAGRDNQWLLGTLDRFVTEALAANVAIEVMNHPDGQHNFDVLNADARSREIIGRTIEFVRASLAPSQ
jgi:acetyl esterase/lipase